MTTIREKRPTRFAFIVFIFVVLFCIGQLTWWIIFQIDQAQTLYHRSVEIYELKIEKLTAQINSEFLRVLESAIMDLESQKTSNRNLAQYLDSLLTDASVSGWMTEENNIRQTGGKIDSAFYTVLSSGIIIYFDRNYPARLAEQKSLELEFYFSGQSNGQSGYWVSSEMFSISPGVLDNLENELDRRIRMFFSEGGFFTLIILLGAAFIYRTLRRSEELKARQQNFIQAVTHEFRTPITSLRLYLETLQSGNVNSEKTGKIIPRMIDDTNRLEDMIDNVLQAGHFSKSDYSPKLRKTNLSDDLGEYLDGIEPYITRNRGKLNRDIQPDIYAQTDYQALGRAVRALIDNAMKYSPPDNKAISIILTAAERNAVIQIIDTGIGIPPTEITKIFDRFYRIGDEMTRTVNGSGLGLYLVRQIINAHSGTVTASSRGTNQGSKFVITLPIAK
ncbi:MAG: HAMP domain-containing sensor histidine kinase [candidate division Zixibacteria bacterium]